MYVVIERPGLVRRLPTAAGLIGILLSVIPIYSGEHTVGVAFVVFGFVGAVVLEALCVIFTSPARHSLRIRVVSRIVLVTSVVVAVAWPSPVRAFGNQAFEKMLIGLASCLGLTVVSLMWYPLISWLVRQHVEWPTGENICDRCGYDLRGLTDRRCPECGTPFMKTEHEGGPIEQQH